MKINILSVFFAVVSLGLNAQTSRSAKVVVTIVVDQMRAEYLNRFYSKYTDDGFKRLMDNGYNCKNVHYNYIPTFTGPGHASIFTGTVPRYHGIVGNSWYDRLEKRTIYCVEDLDVEPVGCDTDLGRHSAKRQMSTTVADELEIFTQGKSLTYSISLKDRAAILSAGHMADGVFWYDKTTGNFISSSYYVEKLPEWVGQFNNRKLASQYMQGTWDLLLPEKEYSASYSDLNPYEHPNAVIPNIDKAVFPYNLAKLSKDFSPYDLLIHTPWGNTLLTELALETIKQVDFGKDEVSDMLMISYSSTDAIGHLWGPQSKEIEDTYLRLDADLARLFKALDEKLGEDNYIVMLTADHAVGEVSQFLIDKKVPAGFFSYHKARVFADSLLDKEYGQADWIEHSRNHLLYFDHDVFIANKVNLSDATKLVARQLSYFEGVLNVFTATQLMEVEYNHQGALYVQNGFNLKRSGDILITLESAWAPTAKASADHGTQYTYDTHVPLLWYGKGIAKGESAERSVITTIAPTISLLLNVKMPNSTEGTTVKGVGLLE